MSGNDAIAFIHNKFGILVISGTAYYLTYSRERDGLKGHVSKKKKRL